MARSLVLVGLALLCAAAGFREFHAGQADRLAAPASPEYLRQALRHAPDDPAKWRQLGIALIRSESGDPFPPLQRAVQLAPCDAEALIALGYESERLRRMADAEQFYLRAAECSRRFQPRYALAGFYLRTGNPARFWPVAAEAVNIPGADVTRIFKLAETSGAAPENISSWLDTRTEHAQAAYISSALAAGHLDPAAAVALKLPIREKHVPLLAAACERMIQCGKTAAAVAIWNRLPDVDKLDPAAGQSIAGASFGNPATIGFHWRYTGLPGTAVRATAPSGLRIDLSGGQPEHGTLLVKMAPVLPNRRYRLIFNADIGNLRAPTGLAWTVSTHTGAPIARAVINETGGATAEFATPAACTLLRIHFVYNRVPGTVRLEGSVHLQSARLELLP